MQHNEKGSLASHYMTKQQLADALGVSSIRVVEGLMRKKLIPYMKIGYRTVRFDYTRVKKTLEGMGDILEIRARQVRR